MHRESRECTVKSVIYTELQAAAIKALQTHKREFELKLDNLNECEHIQRHEHMIQTVIQEIENLKKQRIKLFDLFERNIYEEDDFVERRRLLDERKKAAEKQLLELQSTKPEPIDYEEKIIKLSDAITALKDDSVSPTIKNRYMKEVVHRIEFSRDDPDSFNLDVFLL